MRSMRRKIITLFMISALSLSGCSGDNASKPETGGNTTSETTSSVQETEAPEPTTEVNETSINDIEKYMLDNGAVSGQKTQMAAEMVGAIKGFKYSDSSVEVYEYDVNSKNYKTLAKGKKVPLEGFDGYEMGAVSINGKFVLMGEPSKQAISVFDSFEAN